MKEIFLLMWGIVRNPKQTFKQIKEEKPTKETIIGYLSAIFISLAILVSNTYNVNLISLGQQLMKFTIAFGTLLLATLISNLLAVALKGKSDFKSLLLCYMFLTAVTGILTSLVILFPDITFSPSKILPKGIVGLWYLVLAYIAAHEVYNLSKIKTSLILLTFILPAVITNYYLE